MRAAQHARVELTRQADVVGVAGTARHLLYAFDAWVGAPNDGQGGIGIPGGQGDLFRDLVFLLAALPAQFLDVQDRHRSLPFLVLHRGRQPTGMEDVQVCAAAADIAADCPPDVVVARR